MRTIYRVLRERSKSQRLSVQDAAFGFSVAQRGQILVEYVLLLVVAVIIATVLVAGLVRRDPDSPGVLIQKWNQIITLIGEDAADDVTVEP